MNDTGRNDPCPCGSGLKFKKCCLQKGLPAQPNDDAAASARALAYKEMSLENWDDAIDHFKACLDSVDDRSEILEAMAACYDGVEDYLLAAEYHEKALQTCPPSLRFDLQYRMGISRACAERLQKAEEAFSDCLNQPGHDTKRDQVRQILQALEDIKQGKQPASLFRVQVQLQRAFSDMEAERYEAAAERLENISRLDSENPAIFYNLGVVYTFLGRVDEALGYFQRCLDLNPSYAQAWYNMGQICLIKKRDFSRARHCFERAVAIRPEYVGAYHQCGIACEMLADKEAALKYWRKTLELDPENALAKESMRRVESSSAEPASDQD